MNQEEKTCAKCRWFKQHYTRLRAHTYIAADCGHCSNPRHRAKKPDTPACQRFSKKGAEPGDNTSA